MSVRGSSRRYDDASQLAARLRHRLSIEQPVYTEDAAGGGTTLWSEVATVWGEIRTRGSGGGERLFGGALEASATQDVTIRYRSDVTPKMRIVHGGRVLNIRRVENVDGANVILHLETEEGVA